MSCVSQICCRLSKFSTDLKFRHFCRRSTVTRGRLEIVSRLLHVASTRMSESQGKFPSTFKLLAHLNWITFKLEACARCDGSDLILGQLTSCSSFRRGSSCSAISLFPGVLSCWISSSSTKDHVAQLVMSLIMRNSSIGNATACDELGFPIPRPINSGPTLVTAVAPTILRYFKLGSCPTGGSCSHDMQLASVKCFTDGKWVPKPNHVG